MKTKYSILFFAITTLAFAGIASSQTKQTVEGAQNFLQGLNAGGGSGAYPVYLVGGFARFDGDPALLKYWQKAIDDVDESGKLNPCVTRITDIDFSFTTVIAKGERWDLGDRTDLSLPANMFPVPRYIHWGKTSIRRETVTVGGGTQPSYFVYAMDTTAFGASGNWEAVGFSPPDSGLADRIEYAMKFLQASCDSTESTGF